MICRKYLNNVRSMSPYLGCAIHTESGISPDRSIHPLRSPTMTNATINRRVVDAQYAVRGRVLDASMKIRERMAEGQKYPYDNIVALNIGNPQALRQLPLTFPRQVLSLCLNPSMMDAAPEGMFEKDAIERAKKYLKCVSNAMGAYSNSQGIVSVRKEIAEFIESRDNYPSHPNNIFITNGASDAVKLIMQCLIREDDGTHCDGILTPIPQYPLYSALLTLFGGKLVPYHLKEEDNWGVSIGEIEKSLENARNEDNFCVRAICVINPGNPTGGILTEDQIKDIIKFAVDENLVLMADEVYQSNVWQSNRTFVSFKKVACDMGYTGEPGDHRLQLVSFHSISKGYMGECGLRGGYMELHGISDDVRAQIYKLCSISLCSNTPGQIMVGMLANPPKPNSPSYPLFNSERQSILASLKRRSKALSEALNTLEGVSCNDIDGAMYAFPKITPPQRAVEIAKERGVPVDEYYCLEMLELCGIVLVPGSGFGQELGTFHFRTTFLPSEEQFPDIIRRFKEGHAAFMAKHA